MLLEHTHVDPGSYMRWELEPVDTGCVLRLSHFVTDTAAAIDNCYVVGLHTSLARLGAVPRRSSRRLGLGWLRRGAGALRQPSVSHPPVSAEAGRST